MRVRRAGSSTLDGRCSVTTMDSAPAPMRSRNPVARAAGSEWSSVSIITLPTNAISSSGSPSRRSVSLASRDGVSSRFARRSVTSRLISSGIVRS
jgi:hypothetical protein